MTTHTALGRRHGGALVSLLLLTALLAACASTGAAYHRYVMRGLVVEVADRDVSICIGSRDGAKVGQQLEAFRIEKHGVGPKGQPTFERHRTGVVQIAEIFDEHFARATVISGEVKEGNVVELEVK
jgi:hypothetical protein